MTCDICRADCIVNILRPVVTYVDGEGLLLCDACAAIATPARARRSGWWYFNAYLFAIMLGINAGLLIHRLQRPTTLEWKMTPTCPEGFIATNHDGGPWICSRAMETAPPLSDYLVNYSTTPVAAHTYNFGDVVVSPNGLVTAPVSGP